MRNRGLLSGSRRRRANLAILLWMLAVILSTPRDSAATGWLAGSLGKGAIASLPLGSWATAAGTLDSSFGNGGFAVVPLGSWATATAVAVTPDGRIITTGEANVGGRNVIISTRFRPDGSLDPGYGNHGVVTVDVGGAAGGNAIALQNDGKIVIAGTGAARSTLAFVAVRLLQNGRPDPSFGSDGIATVHIGTNAIANAVAIQPNGRIVLGGTADGAGHLRGGNEFAVVRLRRDGSVDRTFGRAGITTLRPAGAAWGLALQRDRKIILAGQGSAAPTANPLHAALPAVAGSQSYVVARMGPDGAPDPGFGKAGIVVVPIGSQAVGDAVALAPDGRISVAGTAYTDRAVAATLRLMPDGSPDPGFGVSGVAMFPLWQAINAVTLQPDGKLVLAGTGTSAVRLDRNGAPDLQFGTGGLFTARIGADDAANGVALQPDRKIVLAGCVRLGNQIVLSVVRLSS